MDLTSRKTIKSLCQKYNVYPQRRRGQNFLIEAKILDKIVEVADLRREDVVLEIGPGFGALTEELAKKVKRVVAVEADRRLVAALHEILAEYKNVEIVEGDILKFPISDFRFSNFGYKIVANLPYQITSAVFRRFLESEPRASEMAVMVQKEVAERICALPSEMSLLSVSVQFFGEPEIIEIVPRAAFWPEPEVDSAILKISNIKQKTTANIRSLFVSNSLSDSREVLKKFFHIVKIAFSARRKQLQNNLSASLPLSNQEVKKILTELGFNAKIRAQALGVDDWIRLVGKLTNF